MIYHGNTPVTEVVLHTAALSDPLSFFRKYQTPHQQRDAIDRMHKNIGWKGIGYHAVAGYWMEEDRIKSVEIVDGRPKTEMGAHVRGHNKGTLGLCMLNIRPHEGITKFEDYFPQMVKEPVRDWIESIDGIEKVSGHNDYTALKECPGFKVVSDEWTGRPQPWWKKFWF